MCISIYFRKQVVLTVEIAEASRSRESFFLINLPRNEVNETNLHLPGKAMFTDVHLPGKAMLTEVHLLGKVTLTGKVMLTDVHLPGKVMLTGKAKLTDEHLPTKRDLLIFSCFCKPVLNNRCTPTGQSDVHRCTHP